MSAKMAKTVNSLGFNKPEAETRVVVAMSGGGGFPPQIN